MALFLMPREWEFSGIACGAGAPALPPEEVPTVVTRDGKSHWFNINATNFVQAMINLNNWRGDNTPLGTDGQKWVRPSDVVRAHKGNIQIWPPPSQESVL
mgnify:CR=1 FL=1